MKIRKITEGSGIPDNAVLDGYSTSQTDAYSCNYINGLNTYSRSETRVGTWIDGKPLYRKVAIWTDYIQNGTTFSHGISNADMIYVKKSFFYNSSGLCWDVPVDLYGTGTASSTDRVSLYVDRSVVGFKCDTSWGTSWAKVVILEYTKTTDSATRSGAKGGNEEPIPVPTDKDENNRK